MDREHIKTYPLLLPLAWLYGLAVFIRNKLFDIGILPERSFPLPVISVGNITVGGTGKTPHTEYLIRLLSGRYQVAVLSRGYKRKSHGFLLAGSRTTMQQIGDEPYQMKQKYPYIHMAVDADRCHGIEKLMQPVVTPPADVILLDDAYQHRYVQPDINILLIDYSRPIYKDCLLPAGKLREQASGVSRADIIIITKCPHDITPQERQDIAHSLRLRAYQKLFFTTLRYKSPMPAFSTAPLLVTGIASPRPLVEHLRRFYPDMQHMAFADHHLFTPEDIEEIKRRAEGRPIVTTEKDSARLSALPHTVIPIEIEFLNGEAEQFNKIIKEYVHENSRNGSLHKGKNANKS